MSDLYIKEKKRRRKGFVAGMVALVSACGSLLISRNLSGELIFISLILVVISLVVLLVSMVRYCKI